MFYKRFIFRIENFGFIFKSLNSFLLIPVEFLQMNKLILTTLAVKMILTVLLDVLFLSELNISLKLGVNGVAYSNICTESVNTILVSLFLVR